jgi:hypothetical protein
VAGLPSGAGFSPARLHDLARPHWRLDPFMFSLFPFLFQRFLLHLDLFNELQVQGTYKSPSCFPL